VHQQIAQSAVSDTPVLIYGESGTGKELIARTIHGNSSRAKKPFIKVDGARFPRNLIESETGGGTLFLDEVGRMNVSAQAMFLRVLQEDMKDVRVIAGTSRKLETMVAEGTFRKDFYQRLNVSGIFVPPLRDRSTDLPLLANHFLRRSASEHKKDIRHISSSAIDRLVAYHWPDNVRELSSVIDHAVLVCDSKVVHGHHLPAKFQTFSPAGTPAALSLSDAVSAFEKNILLDALKTAGGNRSKAARLLGSTERIISYKVRKHGIDDTTIQ
jgi:Nif-specific regulatory protein